MKKLFSTRYTATAINVGLLLLRLTVGGLMIPHGYKKLMQFGAKSSTFSDPFGIGHPLSMALVIFAELICAALVMSGLLTRLACIPVIIAMSVAVFSAHHGKIFGEGQEAALFLGGYLAILLMGPGKISLDKFIGK